MGMEVGVATELVAGQGGRKKEEEEEGGSQDQRRYGESRRTAGKKKNKTERAALPVCVLCNPCATMCNGQRRKCARASAD